MAASKLTMEDVGEKAFLFDLLKKLPAHEGLITGFGNDAGVLRVPDGNELVFFNTDRAAAPMAARKGWVDHRVWGRLAVTSSCSDILASGGAPAAVMIAMVVPRDWPVEVAEQIVIGCSEECVANRVVFAGGDTKEGMNAELIGSSIGFGSSAGMLSRKGARPGDSIVVAGKTGGFVGAYLQLVESYQGNGPTPREVDDWLSYVSHPKARWRECRKMREIGVATAAMDASDGLYDAISTLAGEYGADVDLELIPYHEFALTCADRLGVPLFNLATGIADWNVVFVVDSERWSTVSAAVLSDDLALVSVGRISEEPGVRWHNDRGRVFSCRPARNEHFAGRLEDEASFLDRIRFESQLVELGNQGG
ncbi:thiamine-monophosphate kinase [Amycolatopsis sp. NPDC088138]|uniref:thiamine-phosphate kinase n=1 Tax=Amycolatopsis sp. NPDC088138 TaxID=3363938 RepID=UPI003826AC0A